jgi:hypothetical protein
MMAGNWTPGPWSVVCGEGESPHYRMISANALRAGDALNDGIYVARVQGPDNLANAHLIASAPELYEALAEILPLAREAMRLGIDDPSVPSSITGRLGCSYERADAILAKARGERS